MKEGRNERLNIKGLSNKGTKISRELENLLDTLPSSLKSKKPVPYCTQVTWPNSMLAQGEPESAKQSPTIWIHPMVYQLMHPPG